MHLPRGSASSFLTLAAGGLVGLVVALAWLPTLREMGERDLRNSGGRLAAAGRISARQLQAAAPPEPGEEDWSPGRWPSEDPLAQARLLQLLDDLRAASEVDQITLLSPAGQPRLHSPSREHKPGAASLELMQRCLRDRPEYTGVLQADGLPVQLACVPLRSRSGAELGMLVVTSEARWLPDLRGTQGRGSALALGLGAISGLIVMFGLRWILSPVQQISDAAAQIALGTRGLRVSTDGPEEIAQLGRALNSMAISMEAREDEIRSRLAVVTQLSSMVAHEVRNPLQSLSLLCTLARTESDEQTRNQLLSSLEAEIHGLEGVVQRFLRNSGPLQIQRTPCDLVQIIQRAAALAEPEARKRGVSLMVQLPGRLEAEVDGSLLRRAVENLMLNAIEFAARNPQGHVSVAVQPRGRQAALFVDDDGPGIPPAEMDRIFQPYYSSKSGGTGLGLALVKQVMEAHGGGVRAESSPLGGARFTATLPLQPEPR